MVSSEIASKLDVIIFFKKPLPNYIPKLRGVYFFHLFLRHTIPMCCWLIMINYELEICFISPSFSRAHRYANIKAIADNEKENNKKV